MHLEVVTTKKKIRKASRAEKRGACPTAAAILGRPVTQSRTRTAKPRVKAEWQKFYNHLLELREQLLRQMNGLAKESAQEMSGYSLHMADSGHR